MDRYTSIGRAVFAALTLAVLVVACDDGSPTKTHRPEPQGPETVANPWTTIFAAAQKMNGAVKITFAGKDRSYVLGELDGGSATPQDAINATQAVCTIEDATNRRDLDAFRQCMATALREDVCRNGGIFVLYHPAEDAPNSWRALCPTGEDDDEPEDDESRVTAAPSSASTRLG